MGMTEMWIRVAFDPGETYRQRVHQTDMELPDNSTDEQAIARAREWNRDVLGVMIWNHTGPNRDDGTWRTIYGTMP